ncbi:hypothetical protein [Porphyromonas sp. COT-239 OH1446]|uniref:hypothetical protein n=1 Tax=Porphyromonas sp. COT-239 OH1446 TaxID=1515613 RepID=UPI00052CC842|nr:hypothetical protein [Porphyromonas sp. COT-239 OH1446]KGN71407.1 hypothetical protein HQ37_02895 [Porphyromonas sp. COT-239 OH1446]
MSVPVYSRHIFIFPFQWDYIAHSSGKGDSPYRERTSLEAFDRVFSEVSPLRRTYFEIGTSAEHYSEYVYFHPFVRPALFATKENESVYCYELAEPGGSYNIKVRGDAEPYQLVLEKVSVQVFDTGVGVMSFFLRNEKHPNQEDILRINDFGRRIYPQFMAQDDPLAAKNVFLADSISGQLGELNFHDDFKQYTEPIDHRGVFLPPDHIRQIFGYKPTDRVGDSYCRFVFRDCDERKEKIRISPVMDDRMYFLSFYNNASLVKKLEASEKTNKTTVDSINCYESGEMKDFWSKYLFGDGKDIGLANADLQLSETKRCTYNRWVGYGTLMGMTRDSSVYLTTADFIEIHFMTMYYRMAVLCLVQRASILRFRGEITYLTCQIRKNRRQVSQNIKELYEDYIRFINEIHFREVSSQIQGIEMYQLFQRNMGITDDVQALEDELTKLFDYLDVEEQGELNKTAAFYLPISIIIGALGVNFFAKEGFLGYLWGQSVSADSWTLGDVLTIIIIVLCLLTPIIARYLTTKK